MLKNGLEPYHSFGMKKKLFNYYTDLLQKEMLQKQEESNHEFKNNLTKSEAALKELTSQKEMVNDKFINVILC